MSAGTGQKLVIHFENNLKDFSRNFNRFHQPVFKESDIVQIAQIVELCIST